MQRRASNERATQDAADGMTCGGRNDESEQFHTSFLGGLQASNPDIGT